MSSHFDPLRCWRLAQDCWVAARNATMYSNEKVIRNDAIRPAARKE